MKFKSDIEVQAGLKDSSGAAGTSGQILSSNGTTVSWVNAGSSVASDVQNQVKAGVAINKGQAVYVTSADGTNIIVGLASNTSEATSSKTLGLLDATVAINGFANVVQIGRLAGLNTAAATVGDPVWLGANGNLIYGLANKPYAPLHLVFIGVVTRVNVNNGEIFINVQNGFELNEIHDVDIKTTVPVNGDILGYNGTLWVNKTIAGWLGYTPANQAINIATTAPLAGGGNLSANRTLSITQAGTASDGYLSSTDWNTFNGKQAAINGTGFVKASGTTISYDNSTYLTSAVTTLSGGTTGLTPNTATSGAITLAGTLVLANGGTGSTTAAGARTNLGATTVGSNIFTSTNPSAINFLRANADNTVSWLDAATFRTAIGAGTGSGTVTSVAALTLGTTGTDLSSSVANGTTTPVITLNVPTASATNRGALSAADWTTFNNKTSNTGTVTSVSGAGGYGGLTLSGTVTTSGSLTLGGTPTGTWPISISGNASSVNTVFVTTNADFFIPFVDSNNGSPSAEFLYTVGSLKYNPNTGSLAAGGDVRAPIFYDSNNTSYYVDPASTSYINVLNTAGNANFFGKLSVENQSGFVRLAFDKLTFWEQQNGQDIVTLDGGYLEAANSLRAPIFYDSNNTGYYIDPASTSTLYDLNIAGQQRFTTQGAKVYFGDNTLAYPLCIGEGLIDTFGTDSDFLTLYGRHSTRFFVEGTNEKGRFDNDGFKADIMYDLNNTAYYFDGSSTGDSIRVAGDVVAYYSDERLKDKKGNIKNALQKVLSLNGFYYTPNEKAQKLGYKYKEEVGVSAQEVEAILPEIIKDAPIGHGYKTLDYGKLTPLLIEAIKEQQKQIEELKQLIKNK